MGSLAPHPPELTEVADGVFAYLQPDGTWGWSNAGLVAGSGESVLVDTLFDLPLTQVMLDTMQPITSSRPIRSVVNTHANGDHCYGNQLVAGAGVDVIASRSAAQEMEEVPASLLAALMAGPMDGTLGEYMNHAFGAFDFNGIDMVAPTVLFDESHTVDAGGRRVDLFEVGPAHTQGDVLAWLPEEKVLFSGDILFIDGTPIMWAGPVGGWIAAIDRILEFDPEVIVPGHGPLTDADGVRALRSYFVDLQDLVTERHAGGMAIDDAIADIDRQLDDSPYAEWSDRERVVVNVQSIWRELDTTYVSPDIISVFQQMADNFTARTEAGGD
jgi:glyoxylase-like metal-dependent hydrolase (beta-lactamase superfamily II)